MADASGERFEERVAVPCLFQAPGEHPGVVLELEHLNHLRGDDFQRRLLGGESSAGAGEKTHSEPEDETRSRGERDRSVEPDGGHASRDKGVVLEQRVPGCVRHNGGLAAEEDAGAHRNFAGTHARVDPHCRNVVLLVRGDDVDDAKRDAGCAWWPGPAVSGVGPAYRGSLLRSRPCAGSRCGSPYSASRECRLAAGLWSAGAAWRSAVAGTVMPPLPLAPSGIRRRVRCG